MQLKSIELHNFRQYVDEKMVFSTDSDQNVTLVIGENGAGKSTLEQAFRYVLYGNTDFGDTDLINNEVKSAMNITEVKNVSVKLEIEYKNKNYLIKREVVCVKLTKNKVNESKNTLSVWEILANNNHSPLNDDKIIILLKRLFPLELSDYFFIDGEKIEKMSEEIKKGRSSDFSKVVNGILGLNYYENSLIHLGPTKNGLISYYNRQIDQDGGEKLNSLTKTIEEIQNRHNIKEDEIENAKTQLAFYRAEVAKNDAAIQKFPNAQNLQKEHRELISDISAKLINSDKINDQISKNLNINFTYYMAAPLIKSCLTKLKSDTKIEYGIPDIQNRTIQYLLNKGKCICGSDLSECSEGYHNLIELQKFVPPHSLGNSINNFIKDSKTKIDTSATVYDNLQYYYKQKRQLRSEVATLEARKNQIDDVLTEVNEVSTYKEKYDESIDKVNTYTDTLNNMHKEIGVIEKDLASKQSERDTLVDRNHSDSKKLLYLKYAKAIYDWIFKIYKEKEDKVRTRLQLLINNYLAQIYMEELSISVDEKYNISTNIKGAIEGDFIKKSTGQSYIVIFAFISSIIKMAKRNTKLNDSNEIIEDEGVSESYPLVLDAPVSSLDLSVIKNLCDILPNVAEQLIIFVIQKDGDLLKSHMQSRIGKEYKLVVNGLLNTKISEVQ